jgi:Tfp pilus assembly protein PilN
MVRSGAEDTLVLFIEGNTLRQSEYLPELTSEDSAETICSRVLLLQDEYGMGEVQHLMLVAEENESALADAFKSYFAGANLRLLRAHLPNGEETESGSFVSAKGAALRLLDDPNYGPFFQPVNLLAKRYTASSFRLPVGWSVPLLLGLLAATTLVFVWYYFMNASAISERRTELQALEQEVQQVDREQLRGRIDSLEAATEQYAQANQVVGALLEGSNKWSKALATTAGQINQIQGLTIEQWGAESDTELMMAGRSTDREKVVQFAEELSGDILTMTFTETREVPLYNFQLTVPMDTTKPEAIEYWREQRGERLAAVDNVTQAQASASGAPSPESSSASSPGEASPASASVASSTGSSPPSDGGRWMVVVASLAQSDAAEEVATRFRERLESDEYTVKVRASPENGRYRVGVGTFSTFSAAWSAQQEMGERLPTDAWLHKFSPTTASASGESQGGTRD